MLELLAAVTCECSNVPVPEATPLAMQFYKSGNLLWLIEQAWSFILPLLFLVTGFTGKLGAFSTELGKKWFFSIAIYLILFTGICGVVNLPLEYYASYIRPHAYSLSSQTLSRWFGNYSKGVFVGMIGAIAFVWIFYLLLKKSPRRWWIYSSLASVGILFIVVFIQPIWIDPLFNKFGPMKDKALEQKILHLAARAGIENGRVYEVDKSQDTKTLNAYVVGFGSTNRIVLWDTTIQQMPTDQLLFVMGHEMGHYILHHIWWDMVYLSALSFAVFYLTYKSANYLLKRYKRRFGFTQLHQIASFPLLLFLLTFFLFLFSPLSNFVSRCMEHEADRFGLEITQNNRAAAEGFITLQQKNLGNPRPGNLYKFWRASHPPLGERIDFSNTYCPWRCGQPMKYAKDFKE